jgi:predicted phosphodiesterase
MSAGRVLVIPAVVVVIFFGIVFFATCSPRPVLDGPPGSFSIAVLGDAPYHVWEEIQYRYMLRDLAASNLAWILHVGDMFSHPCTDDMYHSRLAYFLSVRHAVIYTPGDNDWFDCHKPRSGAIAPRNRLSMIRALFFRNPTLSLGGSKIPVMSQSESYPYEEFVENVRWEHRGIVFVTVHLIGSRNGLESFEGRTAADDEEWKRRTEAAAAWIHSAFAVARRKQARSVFIAFHANLYFKLPADTRKRKAYEPFLTALEEESAAFPGPVVIAHGDGHKFIVDHPLVRRTDGRRLENVIRLEVPGSPNVGWVRVLVTPSASDLYQFEPR